MASSSFRSWCLIMLLGLSHPWLGERCGAATNEVSLDGTKPFLTIQSAIDKAKAGDFVLVYPGTYKENIDFKGKGITVGSKFIQAADPMTITNTVIDGNANGLPVVSFKSHETLEAKLVGFTVRNGFSSGGAGGIAVSVASATISHCRILKNKSVGVDLYYADKAELSFCAFEENTGGGIYTFASSVVIDGCSFVGNSRDKGSAIFWFARGDVQVRHSYFSKNRGSSVIELPGEESGGQAQLINCTLDENLVTSASVRSRGTIFIVNSILQDNVAKQVDVTGVVFVDYSVVRGGLSAVANTVPDTIKYGANNLTVPVIFDPSSGLAAIPRLDSPTIGAGTTEIVFPGATIKANGKDLYGNDIPSPLGSTPDIGAVELPFGGSLSMVLSPLVSTARFGQGFTLKLEVNNRGEHFDYSNLPGGLTGDGSSGVISGIPREIGTNLFTVAVRNKWGVSTNIIQLIVQKGIPNVTWNPPASIQWGVSLNTNVYAAQSAVPGQFTFDPPLGSAPEVGLRTLTLTFTPSDPADYETVTITRQINVVKADQQLNFRPPITAVLGDSVIQLTASSSSGLPVRFEIASGPGRLNGSTLEVIGGGIINVRALQDGDNHYNAAVPVNQSIEVKIRPQIGMTGSGSLIKEPNAETFGYGTSITLTAIPDAGFLFDGWKGDVVSKANPLSITITNNARIEAVFNPQWTLTLSNTFGGTVISEPATNALKNGASVTLAALPEQGYGFRGWLGTFATNSNPLSFVLNTNINLTAVFARIMSLTVQQANGGKITITPLLTQYLNGDQLTAIAEAQEGFRFDGWQGAMAGQSAKVSLVLTNDLILNAAFKKLLTVLLSQSGDGIVTAIDGVYHDVGETVTVKAEPSQGWAFTRWEGATSVTNNPITLSVTTNTALKAIFKRFFTLTLNVSTGGVVELNPIQAAYLDGTSVTLLGKQQRYYRFDRWTGGFVGTNLSATLSLVTNLTIGAVFAPSHRLLPTPNQDLSVGFKMQAEGEEGSRYVIEASSGLASWNPLVTITNKTGAVEFVDQQARVLSRRFYRIRSADP